MVMPLDIRDHGSKDHLLLEIVYINFSLTGDSKSTLLITKFSYFHLRKYPLPFVANIFASCYAIKVEETN